MATDLRPTTPTYGALCSKPSTPSGGQGAAGPAWENFDPRHHPDTPIPWLRYFFPKDFELREGAEENAYYQFFDVTVTPMEEDVTVPPPKWTPNAYFRLSFTQTNLSDDQDVAARTPVQNSPMEALDFTRGDWPVFAEGAEAHLQEVKRFCRSVATLKARTWKDAFPLVDLLRGLLLYILRQMDKGQQLAEEYGKRNAVRMVEEERQRGAEEQRRAVAAKEAEVRAAMAAAVAAAKEATRKAVMEEMATQMKSIADEKDKWVQKSILGEQQMKKLNESIAALQRQLEQMQDQMEATKIAHGKVLGERDGQLRGAESRIRDLEDALARSKKCIVDALKTRGRKQEVLAVVAAAAALAVPGAHAYVAQLRGGGGGAAEDPAMLRARQALAADPDSPLREALAALHPSFLSSPMSPEEEGGAALSMEQVQSSLVLRYTAASAGQDFMVGQSMAFGMGVSWAAVAAAAKAAAGQASGKRAAPGVPGAAAVLVSDVSERDGVHFFRPSAAAGASHGSYLAVPLTGRDGQVVGLLGVDTIMVASAAAIGGGSADVGPGITQLGNDQVEFIKGLGAAASEAIAHDQDQLADIMFKASVLNTPEEELESAPIDRDPEPFADLRGGLAMFKSAVEAMRNLTDDDLEVFRNVDKPDDGTLAILRSILAAAGEVADGDWYKVRSQVDRGLFDRLMRMDPKGAWSSWKDLCQMLTPLMGMELELGRLDTILEGDEEPRATTPGAEEHVDGWEEARGSAVATSLARWAAAVRKISAASALLQAYQERLHKANQALMRTFQGDGSNALVELRTYRVPPKITFQVLQAVLVLAGNSDTELNWGKMRTLTNYKLIKKLVDIKPENAMVPHIKMCNKVAKHIDEEDVKKESMATLILYKWLVNFAKVGELSLQT